MPPKRAVLLAAALPLVVVGAVVWARGADRPVTSAGATIPVTTTEVVRTDLSTSRTLRGTLGYGPPRVVSGARPGVLTWLPRPGRVVQRGKILYRINDVPVPLLYGAPPLYRTLGEPGTVGRDVAMLRKNLKALGYDPGLQPPTGTRISRPAPAEPITVRGGEAVLTPQLVKAVKQWQRDLGMPPDGVLEVGDLVVLPGAVRVDTVTAVAGDSAEGGLLSVTRTKKVVSAQVDAAEAGSLKRGAEVTLRMPDGAESPGVVATKGSVATTAEGAAPGQPQQVAVTIDPDEAGDLDGGDVEIEVAGETRDDVLAVPVTTLLALREGGYALQLADSTLLPVETGLFAQGLVEVTGDGLSEGLPVVTTS